MKITWGNHQYIPWAAATRPGPDFTTMIDLEVILDYCHYLGYAAANILPIPLKPYVSLMISVTDMQPAPNPSTEARPFSRSTRTASIQESWGQLYAVIRIRTVSSQVFIAASTWVVEHAQDDATTYRTRRSRFQKPRVDAGFLKRDAFINIRHSLTVRGYLRERHDHTVTVAVAPPHPRLRSNLLGL